LDVDGSARVRDVLRAGNWRHVLSGYMTGTASDGYLLTTSIPFDGSVNRGMHSIRVKGYAYGLSEPVDFVVNFYLYTSGDRIINRGWTNYGAYDPGDVRLSYEGGVVKLWWSHAVYYPHFEIFTTTHGSLSNQDSLFEGWTLTDDASPTTDVFDVEYRNAKPQGLDIEGNLSVDGTIADSDGDVGVAGQVLSSTATGTNWIDRVVTSISSAGLSLVNGVLSILYDDTTIGINGSNELEVKDNGINSAKIADGSIGTADISDSAINGNKLADNSVNSAKVVDGSIQAVDLADTYLASEVDGSTTNELQDLSLDTATNILSLSDGATTVDLSQYTNNIYTADGMLTTDRNVSFDGNDLSFDIDKLFVDGDNGRIGIGTETPSSLLNLLSSGSTELTIEGGDTGYINAGLVLKANNDTNYRGLGVFMHDVGGDTEWYAGRPYSSSDQYQIGRASGNGNHDTSVAQTSNAFLTINNSGNVGIGTTTPNDRLVVDGNIYVTGAYRDSSGDIGVSGQVLVSTGTSVDWQDPISCIIGGAKVQGDGTVINSYGNISGVNRTNTGRYTVNFANTLNTDDYYAHVSKVENTGVRDDVNIDISNYGANSVNVIIHEGDNGTSANTYRDRDFSITLFDANCTALSPASNSDERLKKDIETLDSENSLQKVLRLRPVRYRWNTEKYPYRRTIGFDEKEEIGLIAQEVEDVVPEVVDRAGDGYFTLDYGKLVSLVISSIKDIWMEITGLKEKVEEINMLKNELCARDNSYSWCSGSSYDEDVNLDENNQDDDDSVVDTDTQDDNSDIDTEEDGDESDEIIDDEQNQDDEQNISDDDSGEIEQDEDATQDEAIEQDENTDQTDQDENMDQENNDQDQQSDNQQYDEQSDNTQENVDDADNSQGDVTTNDDVNQDTDTGNDDMGDNSNDDNQNQSEGQTQQDEDIAGQNEE
jgi:hypothetical protein